MIRSTDKPVPSARKLAYQALFEILEKKAYANLILQHMMREYSLSGPESRLLTELVYGVLRKYNYLLYVISRLSSYSLKKMHPSVRILLCLGLYQLLYLSRIPECGRDRGAGRDRQDCQENHAPGECGLY